MKRLGILIFICAIFGIVIWAQDKSIAVKPAAERLSIDFTPSDSAKIARIQSGAQTGCNDITQNAYKQIAEIMKGYGAPDGWEITFDADKNWIGLHKPVEKPPEKKP